MRIWIALYYLNHRNYTGWIKSLETLKNNCYFEVTIELTCKDRWTAVNLIVTLREQLFKSFPTFYPPCIVHTQLYEGVRFVTVGCKHTSDTGEQTRRWMLCHSLNLLIASSRLMWWITALTTLTLNWGTETQGLM